MRHILAAERRNVLARCAAFPSLLAFDFDGTLAPLTDIPANAAMRPRSRELLTTFAQRNPCAVISARAWADLSTRVEGVPLCALVGNHGIEPDAVSERFASVTALARAQLDEELRCPRRVRIGRLCRAPGRDRHVPSARCSRPRRT